MEAEEEEEEEEQHFLCFPLSFFSFNPFSSSHNWMEEVDEGSPQSALLFIRVLTAEKEE